MRYKKVFFCCVWVCVCVCVFFFRVDVVLNGKLDRTLIVFLFFILKLRCAEDFFFTAIFFWMTEKTNSHTMTVVGDTPMDILVKACEQVQLTQKIALKDGMRAVQIAHRIRGEHRLVVLCQEVHGSNGQNFYAHVLDMSKEDYRATKMLYSFFFLVHGLCLHFEEETWTPLSSEQRRIHVRAFFNPMICQVLSWTELAQLSSEGSGVFSIIDNHPHYLRLKPIPKVG